MNYEIKEFEKKFLLTYRGVEIGTTKLHCDAVLIGKQLDRQFELEYHRGCKTLERMLDKAQIELERSDALILAHRDLAREERKIF